MEKGFVLSFSWEKIRISQLFIFSLSGVGRSVAKKDTVFVFGDKPQQKPLKSPPPSPLKLEPLMKDNLQGYRMVFQKMWVSENLAWSWNLGSIFLRWFFCIMESQIFLLMALGFVDLSLFFFFCLFFLRDSNFPEFMESDIAYQTELVDWDTETRQRSILVGFC